MLGVFCKVVDLVLEHEVEVLKELYLLEVKFALVFNKLLEPALHLALVCLFRLLYFADVLAHLSVRFSQRDVLVFGVGDLACITQELIEGIHGLFLC